jgi:hypothetical protein
MLRTAMEAGKKVKKKNGKLIEKTTQNPSGSNP